MTLACRPLPVLVLLAACGSASTPQPPLVPSATPAPAESPRTAPARPAVPRDAAADTITAGPDDPVRPPPTRSTSVRAPSDRARLREPALREVSGLAASRRDDEVLWAINDGGNAPLLHALDRDGRTLGAWPVAARNRDWEDLAAFRLHGEPWLLIADTGDNPRRRDDYALHLVAEPVARGVEATPGTELVPSRTIRFRYADGAHDVEAVAVDETSATVWLLVKEPAHGGSVSSGIHTLSLLSKEAADTAEDSSATALRVARRVGALADVPRTFEARIAAALANVDLEQPTAFDFAPDGRDACVLSYRHVRCFERADGEDWAEILSRPGRVRAAHDLDQAEALTISADGFIRFTSEGIGAPLRAMPLHPIDP